MRDEYLRTDGNGREFLQATYGGSSNPITHEVLESGGHYAFHDSFLFNLSNSFSS